MESDEHLARIRQQLAEAQRGREDVSAELSAAQTDAASAASAVDRELLATKRQLASSSEYLKAVERELANAKESLSQSQIKCQSLERGHNESVSRKSAMHEAFQALKLELSESHEAYRKLQGEVDDLRRAGVERSSASASVSVAS